MLEASRQENPLFLTEKDPDGIMGRLIGELKKRGFMTYSHENMIIVAPPLIITVEQIKEELKKLDEVLYIADEIVDKR